MRKQLSQPSFVNGFARSRNESVRPDLWPDHAWVPALGCQGGVLFDLCGRINGSLAGATTWGSDGAIVFATSSDYVDCGKFNLASYGSFTFLIKFYDGYVGYRQGYTAGNYQYQAGVAHQINYHDSRWIIGTSAGSSYTTAFAIPLSAWFSSCLVYTPGYCTTYFGEKVNGDSITISASASSYSLALGRILGSGSAFTNGRIRCAMLYKRAISANEYINLNIDPLLPFRRRTIQKYWVPAGSETTTYFIPQFMKHKFIPSLNGGR